MRPGVATPVLGVKHKFGISVARGSVPCKSFKKCVPGPGNVKGKKSLRQEAQASPRSEINNQSLICPILFLSHETGVEQLTV